MIKAPSSPLPSHSLYPTHLLLQFVLVDYLKTWSLSIKISNVSTEIYSVLMSKSMDCASLRDKFLDLSEELTGCFSPYRSHFSWKSNSGVLTKLKHTSALFHKDKHAPQKTSSLIKKLSAKCWLYAIELRDTTIHLLQEQTKRLSKELTEHKKVELNLFTSLKELGEAIILALMTYSNNENVLFFLLNHQEALDNTFGIRFTSTLLKNMHADINVIQDHLCQAYRKRGFQELEPLIALKIEALMNQ